jgi:hypothetical protein
MRFRDPLLFLLGVRSSIERVLRCPQSFWLALALVGTAAMAREYDAVSWLHQPRDLLAPFAASLAFGSIIYLFVIGGVTAVGRKTPSAWRDYRLFMTGYWMTAPLAWLYAIPIETMTDEITAVKFNLSLLSIVSIWRVLLFSRVVAIQFAVPFLAILSWVLIPCMMIAFVALFAANLSMVSIMGGLRLTQAQQILVDYQGVVLGGCFYGVIPMIVVGLSAIGMVRGKHRVEDEPGSCDLPIRRSVWLIPVIAIVVLGGGAMAFQPRLHRATEIDVLLHRDEIIAAIEQMQKHGEAAFPIVWDPPPKFPERDNHTPLITSILTAIEQTKCEPWIAERLLVQADEIVLRQVGWYQGTDRLEYLEKNLAHYDLDKVNEALAAIQKLQSAGIGNPDAIAHRQKLLEALMRVRDQIMINEADRQAAEERQRLQTEETD